LRIILLFLLPLWLFSSPFKVASYNVQNLFDVEYKGSEYKAYTPNKWNKKLLETKLNHVAEVICDLNADIIGLQEIENKKVFKLLIRRLKKVGCSYQYNVITSKKKAPIQVALLSRFPIIKHRELQVGYSPFVRNILEVEVKVNEEPLLLFVNHWKSKSRHGEESKRIRYAKRLKQRINALPEHKAYIILGDLNSNYNAHLTLHKKFNDTKGITAIGDILQTTLHHKLVKKHQMSLSKTNIHYNTWQELPYKERWSHKYYGNKSTLDHILLPRTLFDNRGIDYINHSFTVFKPSYLFTKRGYIYRWQYKNGKHLGKGYSDHLPIYALFDSNPYIKSKSHKSLEEDNLEKVKDIEYLYTLNKLKNEIRLNDIVVLFKRGNHAIIKQKSNGRGIYLYACAKGLKEGFKYDILVQNIESYKGLKEVTNIIVLNKKEKVNLSSFYKNRQYIKSTSLRQNEIIKDIVGVYKNKKLLLRGKKIPIYFKKRRDRPSNGTKIKIDYGHIGYYNKIQLVIYRTKDFTVLER